MMNEQRRFESQLSTMRISVARTSGDELEALEVEHQARLEEIRNNELINERQRKEALALIEEEFANRRLSLEEQQADEQKRIAEEAAREKEQIEQDLFNARFNFATTLTSSLQGFGQVLVGDSEKHAKRRFELDKAFSYGSAVVNTATGVTKALSSSPPPVNFINAAAVGTAGAIEIAKISATTFQGSGSSKGNSSFRYNQHTAFEPTFSTQSGSNSTVSNTEVLAGDD